MNADEAHNGKCDTAVEAPAFDSECEEESTREKEDNWVSIRCRRSGGTNHTGYAIDNTARSGKLTRLNDHRSLLVQYADRLVKHTILLPICAEIDGMSLSFGAATRGGVAVILVAALLLSTVTGVAAAQSVQGASGTVVVEEGQTVSTIDTLAGSIVVRGTVTGDVSGVAGTIHVAEGGRVGGSISGAAGDVHIDGEVGGDVSAGSGNVQVSETAAIRGDVNVGAGYVRIDGRIDGDVRVGAETVALGPNADVGGEFRYDAVQFTQDPAATVAGGVVEDSNLRGNVGTFTLPSWVAGLYGLLANLLLGAVLLALFPAFSARLAGRVSDEPAKTGGVGLLTLVGLPILLALVAITIIGIPLAVLGSIAFGLAIWVGVVYGQYAVGAWALRRTGRDDRWLTLVVGLVGFAILGAVPILGGFLVFGALLLGLGALVLGLRDSFRTRRRPGPPDRQTTFDESFADSSVGSSTERTTKGQ